MREVNKIYNEDCLKTMEELTDIDVVLTSPPYNTDRPSGKLDDHSARYEAFDDWKTDEEYIEWTVSLFKSFDKILKPNGCVLYNISYSTRRPNMMWNLIAEVQKQTAFEVADCIIWKKPSALPNNTNPNKLTRLCEFVFVMCRKNEQETFKCYKGVSSERENGQTMYNNVFNFIEAPNNDENCPIHKATYSTLLCRKLMLLYSKEGDTIYDPFMGTGTTAVACAMEKRNYIGSELSERYVDWANKRIWKETRQLSLF
jgi:site-specific DNA-methyltransferase (adenine-specific)/modification methylase